MENINFRGIPTSLFLNGPKLGIVTDPQSLSDVVGVATFTGIATATFPDSNFDFDSVSGGSIEFKWYLDGSRILDSSEDSNSNARIDSFDSPTGAGSTIQINGLSVDDDGKEIYFEADYIPSAYQTTPPVTAGTARSTGNAFNDPLQSGIGTITVFPIIEITTQPKNQSVVANEDAEFTIAAQKTPGGGTVDYQWQLNGTDLSNGTTNTNIFTGASGRPTLTINDGTTDVEVDFSKVSVYDAFTPGVTYTATANADITVKLTAEGGGGGGSGFRNVGGSKGGKSEGTFTFLDGQTYKIQVGEAGQDGETLSNGTTTAAGGKPGGGDAPSFGDRFNRSGAGGGYTGIFITSVTQANAILIAAGGGGSSGDPGRGGDGGGLEGNAGGNQGGGRAGLGGTQTAGGASGTAGTAGEAGSALQGGRGANSGVGAAGGGGGYFGGGGGTTAGPGTGGGGSSYLHPTLITDGTTTTGGSTQGVEQDGTLLIELISAVKTATTTITGANTPNLTISSSGSGVGAIRCKVTATGVQESPKFSNTVSYVVVEAQKLVNIETYTYSNATAKLSDFTFDEFGESTAVCISVVDETDNQYDTQSEVDADWKDFRTNYPKRPFWILRPGNENVTLPTAWSSDSYTNGPIQVKRDGGNVSSRSDWFTLTELDKAPAGTNVSLVVDKSGSMTRQTVAASLDLFLQKCREAGIIVNDGGNEITMSPIEHYIAQHNRDLDNDLHKLLVIDYDKYPGNAVSIYARDQDLNVQMELYGGKGADNGANLGGEGGYSKITLTMKRKEEYIITGLFDSVNAPFIYRKGTLIAVVGEGGDGGTTSKGGQGGGINVAGRGGGSSQGGNGGDAVAAGTLPSSGYYGTLTTLTPVNPDTTSTEAQGGGRTIPCPRGVYWRNQGKSPCEDLGTIKFRTPDGTEISNTGEIERGYKSGYNIIQTKGEGQTSNSGDGGSGAMGGKGGSNTAGGGGGSGYTDGSVTVVDTQLGGSTRVAQVVIRLV